VAGAEQNVYVFSSEEMVSPGPYICNEAKHNIFSTLTDLERLKTFNVVASWMTKHRDMAFYSKYEVLSL